LASGGNIVGCRLNAVLMNGMRANVRISAFQEVNIGKLMIGISHTSKNLMLKQRIMAYSTVS
jgi:hypothetical protein